MHAWCAAYQRPGASVGAAGDWHDRQRPGVVAWVKKQAGGCSSERHQTRLAGAAPSGLIEVPGRGAVEAIIRAGPTTATSPRPSRSGWPAMSTGQTTNPGAATPRDRSPDGVVGSVVAGRAVATRLAVAVGAAVATAHGLYEVAVAARVPADRVAVPVDHRWARAGRLTPPLRGCPVGRRYAWAVVIVAAGLSGSRRRCSWPGRRRCRVRRRWRWRRCCGSVGAWPVIAAAGGGALLYLLAADDHACRTGTPSPRRRRAGLRGLVPAVAGGALRSREPVVSGRVGWDTGQPERLP
ncbi:hypothetical protein HBB16_04985 [Pseudonocardia sp. MCCB 268]|nr:hypothetical protein [Pseudonocardia cytotoxica]